MRKILTVPEIMQRNLIWASMKYSYRVGAALDINEAYWLYQQRQPIPKESTIPFLLERIWKVLK